MVWNIKFEPFADKNLEKLDHSTRKQIIDYLRFKVLATNNPRLKGKALTGRKKGLWRYRVDKYRIICRIHNNTLTIVVLAIAKRDVIYND